MSSAIYEKYPDSVAMQAASLRDKGLTLYEISKKTGVKVGSLGYIITKGRALMKAKPQAPSTAPAEQDMTPLETAIAKAVSNGKAFKIDKGIPLPAGSGKKQPGAPRYPLAEMDVNDSFLATPETTVAALKKVNNAVAYERKKYAPKRSFACRTTLDGIRVWRTA